MTTFVIGDSVAQGIGGAIPGARVLAAESATIPQMQSNFEQAIGAASSGDTVIISAGYNSTGPNGVPSTQITQLQGWIDQLHEKGAHVVVAALRESGMTGPYARLNGQTAQTNRQLRSLRNATFADRCIASASQIAGGNIHGNYADLASTCQAAAGGEGGEGTDPSTQSPAQPDAAASQGNGSGSTQSWGDWFSGIIQGIISIFTSIWHSISSALSGLTGGSAPAAGGTLTVTADASGGTQSPATEQSAEQAQAAARAAAQGNSAAGGTNVAENGAPGATPPGSPAAAAARAS